MMDAEWNSTNSTAINGSRCQQLPGMVRGLLYRDGGCLLSSEVTTDRPQLLCWAGIADVMFVAGSQTGIMRFGC